jgi:hypothetical protein
MKELAIANSKTQHVNQPLLFFYLSYPNLHAVVFGFFTPTVPIELHTITFFAHT